MLAVSRAGGAQQPVKNGRHKRRSRDKALGGGSGAAVHTRGALTGGRGAPGHHCEVKQLLPGYRQRGLLAIQDCFGYLRHPMMADRLAH